MAKATTAGKKKVFRKKEKKNIPVGIAYIAASFNNTMISITDLEGNLIAQSSSGARGFRGSRKGTPFAAQQAAYEAAKHATDFDPENRDENVDYYVAKLDELVKKFSGVAAAASAPTQESLAL